ncbi:MAG: acetyl-CoA carboxylase biotin carboxylase subunit [Planctomycetes bacterium]|nr:acetyl-CoA carboxylase biotin carboxylase subunit [Planctomycetota bacterium]
MFRRLLIANRGEIALRVMRACKELGIETVAVYSQADRDQLHLRFADETVCIGPAPSTESYLNIPALIAAAEIADVEAIHPGYGFLSENAHFVEVCQECDITFVGPSAETIALVGDKVAARELARRADVAGVPGSDGPVETEAEVLETARQIGYPVLIKAAAGGGGRGMRVAEDDASAISGFHSARAEAEAAFNNPTVYIEKLIQRPRHVEIQILGDMHGNIVHLGERDCSLQRRHQKLLEESPCPVLTEEKRREMGAAAIRIAREAGYYSAGTVEFLYDAEGNFYFIEVNARIQVEHPVTEECAGIDLIKEMIRVAAGERLSVTQDEIKLSGHAIEFRINAEDTTRKFQPSPGLIETLIQPSGPGVRWDSHAYQGYRVPPHYDSMVAKLIVHRPTRREAIETAKRALDELTVEGISTTAPLFQRILEHSDFVAGEIDTGFIDRFFSHT